MPEQGYYGTEDNPIADLYSEQRVMTPHSSDPGSLDPGEYRLRTDLNSGDRIATYELNVGNGTEEAPIFPLSQSVGTDVVKVRHVYVPGEGWGFVPLGDTSAFTPVYEEFAFWHNSTRYGWHDWYNERPDSGVSRFQFEQDVTDSWGDNDGTDNTSAGFSTDSAVGTYSKDFDGTNDVVTISNAVVGDLAAFSIAMYIKPPLDTTAYAYSEGDASANIHYVSLRERSSASEIQGFISGSPGDTTVGASVSSDTWYHVVLTVDVGSQIVLYLDGSQADSASDGSGFDRTNIDQSGFGALRRSSTSNYFGGLVDDARMYDKILSSTEASNLYNNGSISG